jgi:2-haloacid dehalogenase
VIDFQPKYITFDCYGTLTAFGMPAVTRELVADRIDTERMENFLDDFEAFRGDEVLGALQALPPGDQRRPGSYGQVVGHRAP